MRRKLFYIVFVFAVVFLCDALERKHVAEEKTVLAEIKEDHEDVEHLLAILTSNNVADLSLQQSNPFNGSQIGKRTSSSRISNGKDSLYLMKNAPVLVFEALQTFQSYYRDYYARQKMEGYYLYTLCKLLI